MYFKGVNFGAKCFIKSCYLSIICIWMIFQRSITHTFFRFFSLKPKQTTRVAIELKLRHCEQVCISRWRAWLHLAQGSKPRFLAETRGSSRWKVTQLSSSTRRGLNGATRSRLQHGHVPAITGVWAGKQQ